MALWERYQGEQSVAAVGVHANTELFHNQEDTDNFQNADIVAVDGILTVLTPDDDLIGIRLLVAHELLTSGDLTEDAPAPDSPQVWYNFFAGRGPLIFRLRSKKTVPPQHKLWVQSWKAAGSATTPVRFGIQIFWQLKH